MKNNELVKEILKEYANCAFRYRYNLRRTKNETERQVRYKRRLQEIAIRETLERLAIKAGVSQEKLEKIYNAAAKQAKEVQAKEVLEQ